MEKKVYIRPSMTEVKIKKYMILSASDPDAKTYGEKSSNRSYSRGGSIDDDY